MRDWTEWTAKIKAYTDSSRNCPLQTLYLPSTACTNCSLFMQNRDLE